MYSPVNRSVRSFTLLSAIAIAALAACGGGADSGGAGGAGGDSKATAAAAPKCEIPSDSIVGGALDHFIDTRTPQPSRMLIQPGDSAVPDGATFVLNQMGRAHYIWPTDPALQKQQIDNMRAKGPFVTMVVFYHGSADKPDGKKVHTFSGFYIDRVNDGTKVDRTGILFDCQAAAGSRYALDGGAPAGGGAAPDAAAGKGPGGDD